MKYDYINHEWWVNQMNLPHFLVLYCSSSQFVQAHQQPVKVFIERKVFREEKYLRLNIRRITLIETRTTSVY